MSPAIAPIGRGNIPEVARARGFETYATDIVDRGYAHLTDTGDLLDRSFVPVPKPSNIIFNPPYSYRKGICADMIQAALLYAVRSVNALVPVTFLGSIERNTFFSEQYPPTQIAFLSQRPSMPPGAKLDELGDDAFKGGKTVYCWLHYDRLDPAPRPPVWLPKWDGAL